jgi:hypothetical protein
MKNEMSDNAYYSIVVLAATFVVSLIAYLLTLQYIRVTTTAIEHGYIEVQNIGTSGTHWTKE